MQRTSEVGAIQGERPRRAGYQVVSPPRMIDRDRSIEEFNNLQPYGHGSHEFGRNDVLINKAELF